MISGTYWLFHIQTVLLPVVIVTPHYKANQGLQDTVKKIRVSTQSVCCCVRGQTSAEL